MTIYEKSQQVLSDALESTRPSANAVQKMGQNMKILDNPTNNSELEQTNTNSSVTPTLHK